MLAASYPQASSPTIPIHFSGPTVYLSPCRSDLERTHAETLRNPLLLPTMYLSPCRSALERVPTQRHRDIAHPPAARSRRCCSAGRPPDQTKKTPFFLKRLESQASRAPNPHPNPVLVPPCARTPCVSLRARASLSRSRFLLMAPGNRQEPLVSLAAGLVSRDSHWFRRAGRQEPLVSLAAGLVSREHHSAIGSTGKAGRNPCFP